MRYAIVFGVYGIGLAVFAATGGSSALLAAWPAASCLVLATAYALDRPGLLGKRADGTQSAWAVVVLAPYLTMQYAVWHIVARFGRESVADEVAPGIWLGRRPGAHEVSPGVGAVFDLTAEFREIAAVRRGRRYVALPTLDATTPSGDALERIAGDVAAETEPLLVHCAWGHGRSALVVACALVARGDESTADGAVARIAAARPRARLNACQRQALAEFVALRVRTRATA